MKRNTKIAMNINRTTTIVLLTGMVVLAGWDVVAAQTTSATKTDIDKLMSEVGNGRPLSKTVRTISRSDSSDIAAAAASYLKHQNKNVRHHAAMLVQRAAIKSTDANLRSNVTNQLIDLLDDLEALVWQHAAKGLNTFKANDFDEAADNKLRRMLRRPDPRREVVRLVGLADLKNQMPRLRTLLIDERQYETPTSVGKWYGTVSWNARLALARMGDADAIDWVVSLVEGEPNDVIRVTVLSRDLGYVGQPKTLAALGRILNSNERLSPTKVGRKGMPVWQYAIDVLADTVDGFPVGHESPGSYTLDELTQAKNWMQTQAFGEGE